MALVFLAAIPYLAPVQKKELGRWFPQSGRIIQVAVAALAVAILVLTFLANR